MLGDGLTTESTESTESTEKSAIPFDSSVVWFLTLRNSVNSVVKWAPWLFAIYLVGNLCLPIASFERYRDLSDPSVPVLGNALAFENPGNRGLLLGLLTFCIALVAAVRRAEPCGPFRMQGFDYACLLWIATPVLVGIFNPSPFLEDAYQTVYLGVVWAGPYLAGRVLTKNRDDLTRGLRILSAAGAVTFLIALSEMVFGRWVYRLLFGYHPFQSVGESRWIGYRPLLCFEDPNQAAMWWMTIAIAAILLVPSWGFATKQARWKWAALSLPFLFQGVGAAVLTLVGAISLSARGIPRWRFMLAGAVVIGAVLFLARGPILVVGRQVAQQTGMEEGLKKIFRRSAIGSFGWRMAREEEGSQLTQEYPIAGWGTVMFWRDSGKRERPWGLVSLVNGAYGIVGTGALLWFLGGPLVSLLTPNRRHAGSPKGDLIRLGVPVLLALHGIDAMMNSALFLPLLYLYGAWVSTEHTQC